MILKKMALTALTALAATGIASATANGQAQVVNDPSIQGTDGSVGYAVTLASDHSSATVDLTSGKFVVTPEAVNVVADDGAVIGAVPTTLHMQNGQDLSLTPSVNETATSLTLTPASAPAAPGATSADSVALQNVLLLGGIGIVAGVAIGCAIGILIGIWFFLVGAVVGCAIGAAIGGGLGFLIG